MMKTWIGLIVAGAWLSLSLSWGVPVFEVRDFGAQGDGAHDDTAAIQKALDAVGPAGGTVHFGAGNYLSRPLQLRTKTTLSLDGATLQASPVTADYLPGGGDWLHAKGKAAFTPLIAGTRLEDVTLEGPGVIEGNGQVWWPEAEKARQRVPGYTLPRPNLINLTQVNHLRVRNLTLQNSPKFHLVPAECSDVVITNVTILAPEHAANTDAIDPSSCEHVLITHCTIDVGDDNVAIKAGRPVAGRDFACEDITISDCTFLHGHGLSIGSETAGGVRHLRVQNCTFENTENGLRIKSQKGKGGLVEDLRYEHITMKNVDPAITLTSYYHDNSAQDTNASAAAAPVNVPVGHIPLYRDIHIYDLTATCPRAAARINGLPDGCISNLFLERVTISAATGMEIANARGVDLKDVQVKAGKGVPYRLDNAEVTGMAGVGK